MSSREDNDGDSQPLQGDSQPLQGDTRKPPADVTKSSRHVDELYNELGDPGRFQILVFVMLAFTFLSVSSNMVVGVFFSYTPEHVCDAAGDFRVNRGAVNSTDSPPYAVGNITGWSTSPVVGTLVNGNLTNVTSRGSCWAVVDNTTRTCDRGQWKYDLDGPESSAVSDFDLVCSRAYLRYLANTLFYIGIMLGSFGFGYFSDVVGRRPVVMVTVYASCGLGVAISFVENYALFVFLRFLMGVVLQGMMTSTYVMTIEQFSCHYRGKA
ncbi:solute carrier family 22 member 16, partial [Aplysia californica]|uniref:Solute carrier family 22 member 16 n=1 Tax=Aplysia californica TaxID=6500 RepID=A0ABM0KAB7_APLCA